MNSPIVDISKISMTDGLIKRHEDAIKTMVGEVKERLEDISKQRYAASHEIGTLERKIKTLDDERDQLTTSLKRLQPLLAQEKP